MVTTGRHDPCVGLRATPIAEAMTALVLMDHWLRHRAQNADADAPSAAPHPLPPPPRIPSFGRSFEEGIGQESAAIR